MKKLFTLLAVFLTVVTSWATTTQVSTRSQLKTAITNAADGDIIQLTKNINLSAAFVHNRSIAITIDLNGHVLNADYIPTSTTAASIFIVDSKEAELTITDSNPTATHTEYKNTAYEYLTEYKGGILTGGRGYYDSNFEQTFGGAIYNNGTVTINGGTIVKNTAGSGGAIYNTSYGTLTISNCTITGNTATIDGGAISNMAGLNLQDGTVIKNNTSTGELPAGGVYEYNTTGMVHVKISGKVIVTDNTTTYNGETVKANLCTDTKLGGKFTYKALVGISNLATGTNIGVTTLNSYKSTAATALQFTSDCAATTDAQYFSSDNSAFAVYYTNSHLDLILSLSDSEDMSSKLSEFSGQITNVQIKRTFYKDGNNNTLCLPFSLGSSTILTLPDSPLAGYAKLQEFSSATIVNKGQDDETLELTMTDASSVVYGTPYIISWASDDNLVDPVFERVQIYTSLKPSSTSNGVTFCGTLIPYAVTANDKGIMFVGTGGQLNWPNAGGNINGFRSYFTVDLASGARFGMNAWLVDGEATGISELGANASTSSAQVLDSARAKKLIEAGKVVIVSNGKRYNMSGQEIK